ncbi:MAG: hypothetical protein IT196_07815 [Acidimicrobiales bacterium]|nr:hypothetical protein [Acidimicrobiales bacterium]
MRLRRVLVGALFALLAATAGAPALPTSSVGAQQVGAGIGADSVPAALAPVQPTRSWYTTTVDPAVFATAGCAMGRAQAAHPLHRSGVVSLIFGGLYQRNGAWVFDLYRGRAATPEDVIAAAGAYADAYRRCVQPATDARLVLVVSTTTSTGRTDAAAGAAMARLAAAATARIEPANPQVWVLGGNDIELGYVGPEDARAWVAAYHGVATRPLVNVGDAAGCPGNRVPAGHDCGSAEFPAWTAADVWAVNGGLGPTFVMPGIYVVDGIQARQWANLNRFALASTGRPLHILGALSQVGACQERPCTPRVRNEPAASLAQLAAELGRSDLYVSDMGWLNA